VGACVGYTGVTVPGGVVKPLVRPVVETMVGGLAWLAGGVGLGVVALVAGQRETVGRSLVGCAAFGLVMCVLLLWSARRAVRDPRPAPPVGREGLWQTARRVGVRQLRVFAFLAVLAAVFRNPALIAALLAGSGWASLVAGLWLWAWERRHRTVLLREPNFRSSAKGELGWFRGGGAMDPRDFYVTKSIENL
jgi:hypothetical protein